MSEILSNSNPEENSEAAKWDGLINYANNINPNAEQASAGTDAETPTDTAVTESETITTSAEAPADGATGDLPDLFSTGTEQVTDTTVETTAAPEFERSRAEETRLAGNFLNDLLDRFEKKPNNPEEQQLLARYIDTSQRFFGAISDPENQQSTDEIFKNIADQYDRTADLYLRLNRTEGANEYHKRSITVKEVQSTYETFADAHTNERPQLDPADRLPDLFNDETVEAKITDTNRDEAPAETVVTENVTEIVPSDAEELTVEAKVTGTNRDEDESIAEAKVTGTNRDEATSNQPKPGGLNADWLV